MGIKYEFDKLSFRFKKVGHSISEKVWTVFKYFIVTASLAVFYYVVFSLFINTDTERQLRRENRMYEKMYPLMLAQSALIEDAIAGLELKDEQIYDEIFHAKAPAVDPLKSVDFLAGSDSIPDKDLVDYVYKKAAGVLTSADRVEANMLRVMEYAAAGQKELPPLSLPLKSLSYAQVGASIGEKINPFYKVPVMHNGVDLIAPQGDPVIAAAEGVVQSVVTSRKGLGNVVEIRHEGGYVTRYAQLADIVVREGQHVRRGTRLASVGISGNSFAPHLHYEVLKDGEYLNPVDFFLASVTPEEYANMLYMAAKTGQSLD